MKRLSFFLLSFVLLCVQLVQAQEDDGSFTLTRVTWDVVGGNIVAIGNRKVCIGTSLTGTLPPDANDFRLFVTDGIRTEKVKVDLATTGWGDYVFAPTYRLRPLAEVEAFIKRYQHLPDVPSEQELEEKGLDLAEMHKIQMVKIEELTLYLIEQQKQIEALQNEIKQLKEQSDEK